MATRRVLRLLARVLLAVPVLGAVLLALVFVRLCQGPIELGWLAHRIAPDSVAGETLGFDRVMLGWRGSGATDLGATDPGSADPGSAGPGPGGRGRAITLEATALSLRRPDGHADLQAARVEVSVDPASLLSGAVLVRRVAIRDAAASLRRTPDGTVSLAGAAPAARPGAGGGAGGGGSGTGGSPGWLRLDRLQAISIAHVSVSLLDEASRRAPVVVVDEAELSPWANLASGRLRATVAVEGRSVPIRGDGTRNGPGLSWSLRGGPVVPADFASLLPALAAVAVPVSPSATLRFGAAGGLPTVAHLSLALGGGTLALGTGTLPVGSGTVELDVTRDGADGVSVRLDGARLVLAAAPGDAVPAPVFTGRGVLSLDHLSAPARIRASLAVDSASVRFDGLARYWPAGIAVGARQWITANIVEGVATGLHVESDLAGESGWGSVDEVGRAGGFDARDMVMWWLRPMPPLRDMRAHLVFQGTDAVLVQVPAATLPVDRAGPEARRLCPGAAALPSIAVSNGSMRITGLAAREQSGAVHLVLSGGLDGLMCALANPRLSLLSKHPVPFTAPSGRAETEVTVRLPLDNDVSIEDLAVSARSTLRGVHLGNVAAGLSLDDADLVVSADTAGLVLDGQGMVGPVQSRLHYATDFRDGPPDQLVEQAEVHGTVDASALTSLGLDAGDALSGVGGLAVSYRSNRDGRSTVGVGLDLTGIEIALPVWSKPAGQAGHADAVVVLKHGHLVSVGPIHADAPALSIQGEVATPAAGPRRLSVPRFLIGRTRGAGEVLFPRAGARKGATGAPIRVTAHGSALDLSAIIDSAPGKTGSRPKPQAGAAAGPGARLPARPPAAPPGGAGPAWTADLRFARVFVGPSRTLGGVSAHLEDDGRALVRARVEADAPTRLALRLATVNGVRTLDGTADDAGALLRGLDVTDQVSGGAMHLTARLPFPPAASGAATGAAAAPITGTVQVDRFVLPDAPFAARLVRDLSIYGWLLAARAPQFKVDRLVAPFSLRGDVLRLEDARAHAPALGVTLRGTVDLGRQTLDLRGTVVPAWALNQLPGRLPLVGRLLAPEKGGGVVAVTLGINGPFAGPRISVNALSALAPGFLRKLFFD